MMHKHTSKGRQAKTDIIQLILDDHKELKKLIKVMKNTDKDLSEREEAFREFAPLLLAHAKPEQQVLYPVLKNEDEDDLRTGGFEGDVEHHLAELMVEESKSARNSELWSARVKVLAELVEHHLQEEEEEIFPQYKKASELEERQELGQKYLEKQEKFKEDRASLPNKNEGSFYSLNY